MSNFQSRVQQKRADSPAGRTDLVVHNTHLIESENAMRVLATYTPMLGAPNIAEVQNWFCERMGPLADAVSARLDTLAVYPDNSFITFLVEPKHTRQPLSAAATMTKAGPDTFLDASNTCWEQVEANGKKFLLRKEAMTVEQAVTARKNQLRGGWVGHGGVNTTRKTILLAEVETLPSPLPGGSARVGVGDVVDFFSNTDIVRGVIKSFGATGVRIQLLSSSEVRTVDPQAITCVVEKGAATVASDDDRTRSYFRYLYPGNPEMVKKISPNSSLSVEDNRPLEVTPISASAKSPRLVVGRRVSNRTR
jgi:hypothetical protein